MKDIKKMTEYEVDNYVEEVVCEEIKDEVWEKWRGEHDDNYDYNAVAEEVIERRFREIYGDEYFIGINYFYTWGMEGVEQEFGAVYEAFECLVYRELRAWFRFEIGDDDGYLVIVAKENK